MTRYISLLSAITSLLSTTCSSTRLSSPLVLDVTDFGAIGDGITEDTQAIQQAIHHASAATSNHQHKATVVLPANKTYVSAPLNLTSNMIFQVDGTLNAIVNTSVDFENDWPQLPPLPQYLTSEDMGRHLQYQSFLYAHSVTNLTIQGSGIIDGRGQWWWDAFHHNQRSLPAGRPNLIQIVNSSHLEITGVTLQNSPFWTLHPVLCDQVHIHHITIKAPMYAPNVDGVDPDACSNVLIEHNDIACGDDHIAVKSGICGLGDGWKEGLKCKDDPRFAAGDFLMSNLTIRYNVFRTGMGIALGSEISGGVENVDIHHNEIGVCEHGHEDELRSCGWGPAFHLKTTLTRGGFFRNVRFANNIVYNNSMFVFIETDYQSSKQVPPPYPTTEIKNISIIGNSAIGMAHGFTVGCSKYMPCQELTIMDNWIAGVSADGNPYECSNVTSFQEARNFPTGLGDCLQNSVPEDDGLASIQSSWW